MDSDSLWVQISRILRDLLPEEASIAIANDHEYLDYKPGVYDIHIQPGTSLPSQSISARVVTQHSTIADLIDESLFGLPYFGRGYPFHLENTWGAVTVIYPPDIQIEPGGAEIAPTDTSIQSLVSKSISPSGQSPILQPQVAALGFMKSSTLVPGPISPTTHITGQQGDAWRPVAIGDIAYFESYDKRNWMHTNSGVYTTIHTMQSLEAILPPSFLRIHRSYIVNIDMIDHITRDLSTPLSIVLTSPEGRRLPVSQSYVRELRRKLGF